MVNINMYLLKSLATITAKKIVTRLEIISDVVSERHVAEKFRCGIEIFPLRAFSDTTSEIISNRAYTNSV